jgi:integrase/recombinase XerD
MFTLAVQTGLRLSEITGLRITSLHLGAGPHVACTGKGRKRRTTPLTTATIDVLNGYLQERQNRPGDALFPNPQGQALSPDAVQQRLSVYVAQALTSCPELAGKTITVHTLRHTAAMRFPRGRNRHRRHRTVARPRVPSRRPACTYTPT